MSVLLAYGDSKEAVIMSDSRMTLLDKNNNPIEFTDNKQKIFRITDKFIVGSAGNANSSNILENINVNKPNSSFYFLRNYSYEEWLEFFSKRIKVFGIDKLSYSPYITIGIDSNNKIRLDTFNNVTFTFDTVIPESNNYVSTIYFSSNVDPEFREIFSHELENASDKEKYCEETIKHIAQFDYTVNVPIQKFKVTI